MKKNAHIIVGLGYGDEGKGTMVDYLCRQHNADLVVRYNGGSQAAHNVVTDDGRHHTFSQFGSGTFVKGVKTLLSKFMLVDPIALAYEAAVLSGKLGEHALNRHFIDGRAPVITPFHVASNRLKEWARGDARHGSCGKGVGETAADLVYHEDEVVRMNMLTAENEQLVELLTKIQKRKQLEIEEFVRAQGATENEKPDFVVELLRKLGDVDEPKRVADVLITLAKDLTILRRDEVYRMIRKSVIVFEGAQGVLLDEWNGFHPYTTWSTITPKNALAVLREAGYRGEYDIIGVTRTYGTRHGAGPFVTHNLVGKNIFPDEHNCLNDWQGTFKFGGLDAIQLRYAIECCKPFGGINTIALTHLDAFERVETIPVVEQYLTAEGTHVGEITPQFEEDLEYQEGITNMLLEAEPVDDGVLLAGPEDAIAYVERCTGLPVGYTSTGWAPGDKHIRKPQLCV